MGTDEGSKTVVPQPTQAPVVEDKGAKKGEEVVPMHQYVGVKEMLRTREQELINLQAVHENEKVSLQAQVEEKTTQMEGLAEKVKNLEEQSKTKVDQVELAKVQEALVKKTGEVLEAKKDLICTKYGVDKETLKDLSDADLRAFEKGLSLAKGKSPTTKPDVGGVGGGSGGLKGSPMELAVQHYEQSDKK